MNVAVVNIFDPLPGEPVEQARYGGFCRALAGRGHCVTWYNSDFSHTLKQRRNTESLASAARKEGYELVLAPAAPYYGNVSLKRLQSHSQLARRLRDMWATSPERPDVILVSTPPPAVARQAANWAQRVGTKLIVDVQDFWPETLGRFWPRGLRWLNSIIFAGMIRDRQAAFQAADGIVGVSGRYIEHAGRWMRPGTPTAAVYLGADIDAFDAAVRPLAELGLKKSPGENWLFLSGSIGNYIDVDCVIGMMAELRRRGRDDVSLIAVGSGAGEAYLRETAATRRLDNVTSMGRQPYEVYASAAAASDIGLAPIKDGSLVYFPYRVFQYFAAGLQVISTISGGELERFLSEHHTGVTCSSSADCMADAVERLLERKTDETDHRRRRQGWVEQFDSRQVSERLVDFVEKVAGKD